MYKEKNNSDWLKLILIRLTEAVSVCRIIFSSPKSRITTVSSFIVIRKYDRSLTKVDQARVTWFRGKRVLTVVPPVHFIHCIKINCSLARVVITNELGLLWQQMVFDVHTAVSN